MCSDFIDDTLSYIVTVVVIVTIAIFCAIYKYKSMPYYITLQNDEELACVINRLFSPNTIFINNQSRLSLHYSYMFLGKNMKMTSITDGFSFKTNELHYDGIQILKFIINLDTENIEINYFDEDKYINYEIKKDNYTIEKWTFLMELELLRISELSDS